MLMSLAQNTIHHQFNVKSINVLLLWDIANCTDVTLIKRWRQLHLNHSTRPTALEENSADCSLNADGSAETPNRNNL